ncbi:hypothetical protein ACWT_3625 [Actinoplanes sp. SE50]|uniref:YcaO-like family protein n=1 Tax=unclassified Actinoplanes TaxID=2626549 RepID=UPI00023EC47D|nr:MULTISPECIES: YcaO-like family protein [unclassified Actinoplanes]AEV84648.1 ycaO-like uncharacterized protein [Actinoplanes sp. SE50/110]ATO83040.1 hypothetical protein ACWT_3625 [Actinoplanes sp. SE50]SLM00448.1 hypothetical protein ACSP50_3680 [Actinoplanes sp. SE50/110]
MTTLLDDPLAALAGDAPPPTEVLLGPLTGPARLSGPDGGHRPGRGLAVLFWRGRIHVLAYRPGAGGCPTCLAWFLTGPQAPPPAGAPADAARADLLWQRLGPALRVVVGRLAARLLRDGTASGTLATVDAATGTVQPGRVPPSSACPACAPEPADTTVAFGSRPDLLDKADGTLRSRRPLPPDLTSDYVGAHSVFREPRVDLDGPVPAAQVGLPLRDGGREPGIGRCLSFARSRRTAVLEGLERYTGFHRQPTGRAVEASLAELDAQGLDPRTLGYHDDSRYAEPDFPFAPLGRHERLRWVPVTPLGGGVPRYLPEPALSWAHRPGSRRPFFYDTSNGFALGQSYEEAALHGLLEIAERDAFLLTWYHRLLLPELTLGPADRGIRQLVDRVAVVTGFRLRLYWAAVDTGIPVVLALARRDAAAGPCTFVSAGANLHPRAAAESAIFEVAAILSAVTHTFDRDRAHGRRLAADFGLVRTMADHSLLGALPQSRPWFDFLTTPERPELALADAVAAHPVAARLDADLDHVRARLQAAGLSAYAADMTTPELRWRGLVCTRVFVPGCLPMTFGHHTRRMAGLPRLARQVTPYQSGLAPGQSPADVPPHPFP